MIRRSLMALSLVTLLGGTGVAFAQAPGQPAETRPMHGMGRMQQRLGLNDDQMAVVKAAFGKHREEQRQAYKELRAANLALRQAALDGADAATIQARTADVQRLLTQTVDLRVKVLQEIGPVLTPEQRAKFAEARTHGGHRHHNKRPATS